MTLCGIKKKLRKISESKYTGTREGVEDTVSPRNYCGKYSALFLVCVPDILHMKRELGTRKYLKNKTIGQTLMKNRSIWLRIHVPEDICISVSIGRPLGTLV